MSYVVGGLGWSATVSFQGQIVLAVGADCKIVDPQTGCLARELTAVVVQMIQIRMAAAEL